MIKHTIVDITYLTQPCKNGCIPPWYPEVKIHQNNHIETSGFETRQVSFGTHTGTHMDAPLHILAGGKPIDQLPLDKMIGEVIIVDLSNKKPNTEVTMKELATYQVMPRMIFRFGWGRHWNTGQFFQDFPVFSLEAAQYLIQGGIELLGMDTPSPDSIYSHSSFPVHKLLLSHSVILIENLANLNSIEEIAGWELVALPLYLEGADGAPIRAILRRM